MSANVGWPARSMPATRTRLLGPGSRNVDRVFGNAAILENRDGHPDNAVTLGGEPSGLSVEDHVAGDKSPRFNSPAVRSARPVLALALARCSCRL